MDIFCRFIGGTQTDGQDGAKTAMPGTYWDSTSIPVGSKGIRTPVYMIPAMVYAICLAMPHYDKCPWLTSPMADHTPKRPDVLTYGSSFRQALESALCCCFGDYWVDEL